MTPLRQSATISPFDVDYDLAPLGAKVLVIPPGKTPAEGVWYPKPQKPIARPATLPAPVRIATALKRNDPLDGQWHAVADGKSLPELGVNDQRYVLYRSHFSLTGNDSDESFQASDQYVHPRHRFRAGQWPNRQTALSQRRLRCRCDAEHQKIFHPHRAG